MGASDEHGEFEDLTGLPDFLRVVVERGIVDAQTARRIELYRRTRGLGAFEFQSSFLNDPPDRRLTFDNFVVWKGNSFAVELARTVAAKAPSQLPYNPLYLYADIGMGKTHLLSAIANAVPERRVILLNTADLEAELERARRVNARAELRQWLVSVDALLIDDIQLCEGQEDLQRDLFAVLNLMTKAHRWVVISSDVPPTQLAQVESRLLSRLGSGVIVSLQMADREARRSFIRQFMHDREMPDTVVDYLASHVTDNVRQLRAALVQLLTIADVHQAPVTIDLAKAVVPPPEKMERDTQFEDEVVAGLESQAASMRPDSSAKVDRFKEMLAGAESREEQALALQIALGERVRQLRKTGGDPDTLKKLERALELVREDRMEEALDSISS
jgi:chromosomal replication initiator protein DnaA